MTKFRSILPGLMWLSGLRVIRRFDSQSEHMPGLQARSPVGGGGGRHERQLMAVSLAYQCFSPSLPVSLKIHKLFFIIRDKLRSIFRSLFKKLSDL